MAIFLGESEHFGSGLFGGDEDAAGFFSGILDGIFEILLSRFLSHPPWLLY